MRLGKTSVRKLVIACLVGLIAMNGVFITSQALAQNRAGGQQGKGKDKGPPPPPPPPRCPDLGVGTLAFVQEIPGQAPLNADEVAIFYTVRNSGTSAYSASGNAEQSVVLEAVSPAGAQVIATAAVPTEDAHPVVLTQGGAWQGHIRARLGSDVLGRPLRLRLTYAADGFHRAINDCNMANNTVRVVRPAVQQAAQ